MNAFRIIVASLLSFPTLTTAYSTARQQSIYLNWKTFNANAWWSQNCGTTTDEWTCCAKLGSKCGSVLERRYATCITPADIDKLATAGVNVLRIPATYAAWAKVPRSNFYSGNQAQFFKNIASYVIAKHSMHIILDIHPLPGGVNGMGFGGGEGRFKWFNNATNLD
ncbi:hypothetical protein G6011_04473 [Alternaria panax]|uniref:glucan 1,3-beta-glucosidase n=1 Tax=Alternaria panax TaxID=48097 RepID=A0AAD4NU21_9PLEO|nr:hypothetical protein G6011_04473 [Alternaria panax]